jgi:hypothetical protein
MRERRKEGGSGGTHAHAVIVSANREMGGMGRRERGAEEERVMGSRALSAVDSAFGIRFPSLFRYNALLFFSSR